MALAAANAEEVRRRVAEAVGAGQGAPAPVPAAPREVPRAAARVRGLARGVGLRQCGDPFALLAQFFMVPGTTVQCRASWRPAKVRCWRASAGVDGCRSEVLITSWLLADCLALHYLTSLPCLALPCSTFLLPCLALPCLSCLPCPSCPSLACLPYPACPCLPCRALPCLLGSPGAGDPRRSPAALPPVHSLPRQPRGGGGPRGAAPAPPSASTRGGRPLRAVVPTAPDAGH